MSHDGSLSMLKPIPSFPSESRSLTRAGKHPSGNLWSKRLDDRAHQHLPVIQINRNRLRMLPTGTFLRKLNQRCEEKGHDGTMLRSSQTMTLRSTCQSEPWGHHTMSWRKLLALGPRHEARRTHRRQLGRRRRSGALSRVRCWGACGWRQDNGSSHGVQGLSSWWSHHHFHAFPPVPKDLHD